MHSVSLHPNSTPLMRLFHSPRIRQRSSFSFSSSILNANQISSGSLRKHSHHLPRQQRNMRCFVQWTFAWFIWGKYTGTRIHRDHSTDHTTNSTILPQHPSEVVVYAARHNYPELLREAALLLLDNPWTEVITDLPDNLVIPWVHIQYLFSHLPHLIYIYCRYGIMRTGERHFTVLGLNSNGPASL
jgi:hypothetical protein